MDKVSVYINIILVQSSLTTVKFSNSRGFRPVFGTNLLKYDLSERSNSKDFGDQYHLSEVPIKREKPGCFRNQDLMSRSDIEIQLMSPLDLPFPDQIGCRSYNNFHWWVVTDFKNLAVGHGLHRKNFVYLLENPLESRLFIAGPAEGLRLIFACGADVCSMN